MNECFPNNSLALTLAAGGTKALQQACQKGICSLWDIYYQSPNVAVKWMQTPPNYATYDTDEYVTELMDLFENWIGWNQASPFANCNKHMASSP